MERRRATTSYLEREMTESPGAQHVGVARSTSFPTIAERIPEADGRSSGLIPITVNTDIENT